MPKTDEKILERNRQWWAKNASILSARRKASYAESPEKAKKKAREYYEKNKESRLRALRAYREQNRELIREQHRQHYRQNIERRRSFSSRQRAKRRNAEGRYTEHDVRELMLKQKSKCAVCLVKFEEYHIDHIQPLSVGGTNYPSNLQLLCAPCNLKKSNKDPLIFMQENGYLL
jgi:5-methylcytosine-specific restriction endonuclease McrA